jgi:UDP-N-acetylglucosamine/UDP-N-acetylgalactosamine 4-epimerase
MKLVLGYDPMSVKEGLKIAFEWYRKRHHFSYST